MNETKNASTARLAQLGGGSNPLSLSASESPFCWGEKRKMDCTPVCIYSERNSAPWSPIKSKCRRRASAFVFSFVSREHAIISLIARAEWGYFTALAPGFLLHLHVARVAERSDKKEDIIGTLGILSLVTACLK